MKKMWLGLILASLFPVLAFAADKGIPPFEPLPAPAKQLLPDKDFDHLTKQPAALLAQGVCVVGDHYGWQTTETLIAFPNYAKQLAEFEATFGCHMKRKHKVCSSAVEDLLILGSKHLRYCLEQASDADTSATFRRLSTMETREGQAEPIRHVQTVIRGKNGKLLYFHDVYGVMIKDDDRIPPGREVNRQ